MKQLIKIVVEVEHNEELRTAMGGIFKEFRLGGMTEQLILEAIMNGAIFTELQSGRADIEYMDKRK